MKTDASITIRMFATELKTGLQRLLKNMLSGGTGFLRSM